MKFQQKIRGTIFKSKHRLYNASPTILSVVAGAGLVATVVLAVRATPKALEQIKEGSRENHDGDPYAYTKAEAVQSAWKYYAPAAGTAVVTLACIFGSNALNKKQQANLLAAYTFLDQSFRKYRHKVVELLGEDGEREIRESIAKDEYTESVKPTNDEILFYEPISERYFSATYEAIKDAEYHFNRNFVLRGYATLNELYEFLGLDPTELGSMLGWSMGAGCELYGYEWVDFEHHETKVDDGLGEEVLCYILHLPFEPTSDYLDY